MKKLLIGLLALGSISAFSAEVCLVSIPVSDMGFTADCTSSITFSALDKINGRRSQSFKYLVEQGYEIKGTTVTSGATNKDERLNYTFIKN